MDSQSVRSWREVRKIVLSGGSISPVDKERLKRKVRGGNAECLFQSNGYELRYKPYPPPTLATFFLMPEQADTLY